MALFQWSHWGLSIALLYVYGCPVAADPVTAFAEALPWLLVTPLPIGGAGAGAGAADPRGTLLNILIAAGACRADWSSLHRLQVWAMFAASDAEHRAVWSSRQRRQLCIGNNSSFHQKPLGVPDGSDGSDGTSHRVTKNYMLLVTQATCRDSRCIHTSPRVYWTDVVTFRCTWEHLGVRWITVEQFGKNFFFGNAAGVPGNHSDYWLFAFSLYFHLGVCVSI